MNNEGFFLKHFHECKHIYMSRIILAINVMFYGLIILMPHFKYSSLQQAMRDNDTK